MERTSATTWNLREYWGSACAVRSIGRRFVHGLTAIGVVSLCAAGCATRAPVVDLAAYPSYPFPIIPPGFEDTTAALEHERAWLFLQAGDLRAAEVGFTRALSGSPEFHPSTAGLGFVELARGATEEAVFRFEGALKRAPSYVPALLGRGEALLAADRVDEAIGSFEAAFAADPGLISVLQRVEELRFAGLMAQVNEARAAGAAGLDEEALVAYGRLIELSPESSFLYLELAEVERRQGSADSALGHLEQAVLLDPNAVSAWMMMAEIYLAESDLDRSEQALLRADAIESRDDIARALLNIEVRRREADRSTEFPEIEATEVLTRGQLATLVGVQFESLLEEASVGGAAIITDARDYSGYAWLLMVVQARVMEGDANYRFEPERNVTRAEFADVLMRIYGLGKTPVLTDSLSSRPRFSDLAPSHLSFSAASEAVSLGILFPLERNTFQPGGQVTGADAIASVERLRLLFDDER